MRYITRLRRWIIYVLRDEPKPQRVKIGGWDIIELVLISELHKRSTVVLPIQGFGDRMDIMAIGQASLLENQAVIHGWSFSSNKLVPPIDGASVMVISNLFTSRK